MRMAGRNARLRVWSGTGLVAGELDSAGNLMLDNEWQQITVVANHLTEAGPRTVTVDFYRNGAYVSTATYANATKQMVASPDGFKIGNAMWDPDLLAQYGAVALFDRALTADEVREYYLLHYPEPGTMMLLAAGLGGLVLRRRRRG